MELSQFFFRSKLGSQSKFLCAQGFARQDSLTIISGALPRPCGVEASPVSKYKTL